MNESTAFDLTPSPRVLRMLGQIDFRPWQCLAELVDNSVDAFLSSGGRGEMFPQVNVEVSSLAEIRNGDGKIHISDNGPGMSAEVLQDAVRAGFSGNNSIDKLGLFGMGFNVATARLGYRTEVWTTRAEDDYWSGIRIDFDEMEGAGSFQAPALNRRKSASESQSHGTEIVISKLDRERAQYLRSGGGLKATRDRMSRVYNRIMREIGLRVFVCGAPLEPREFCTWDKSRFVQTTTIFGSIPAILDIDEDLGSRLYCEDCWTWLIESDEVCPVCLGTDRLSERTRRVKGWLGIQRYFDQQDYGIDLIRNGRVIEERSKVFFSWTHPDTGEVVPEYPLEQTHWGGRIVGELNIDFVPLASHQKDAFDKQTTEWHLVEKVIRGEGPLLVELRKRLGHVGRNESPLARLHTGYRRGSPSGFRTLVPGDASGKGINEEPKRWASYFWTGDPEYLSDEKWWDAVRIAEESRKKKGAEVTKDLSGGADFGTAESEDDGVEEPDPSDDTPTGPAPTIKREPDPSLSGTFTVADIPGAPTLEVTSERLTNGGLTAGQPVEFSVVGTRAEFVYDPEHALFRNTLVEPVDCLVEEIAYQLLARSSTSQREWPLSRITRELREQHFRWTLVSYDEVRETAESLLSDMVEHYQEALPTEAPLARDDLTDSEFENLAREVARIDRAGMERVADVIHAGEIPRYLGPTFLPSLVTRWPHLLLDSEFLVASWSEVSPELRDEVLRQVSSAVDDLLWIRDPGGIARGSGEWRSLLARAASSARLLEAWRA
ncbi:MAG: ATP-binding protein [Gammaproteobacteria bacterium]|nr:ATP-binding protein [Gammaproteobacteria bacterium]